MRLCRIFVATIALGVASPRPADACSPAPCGPGYFVPADGATVPANTPALYWRPMRYYSSAADLQRVTLTSVSPMVALSFTATPVAGTNDYLIVPDQPLVADTSYVLDDDNTCGTWPTQPPRVTFQVAQTAPLPTELGVLAVAPAEVTSLTAFTVSGTCTTEVLAAHSLVTLTLATDAAPWRDALHFETLVDGVVYWQGSNTAIDQPPGSNGRGRGIDFIYRVCHTDDSGVIQGIDGAAHDVTMRATLPGTNLELTTPPISIQLDCPPEPPPADAGVSNPPVQTNGCATTDVPAGWLPIAFGFVLLLRRRR